MTDRTREFQICLPIADRRRAMDFYTQAFSLEPVGTLLAPPDQHDWGYSVLCVDPDGHAWQLESPPED